MIKLSYNIQRCGRFPSHMNKTTINYTIRINNIIINIHICATYTV